MISYSVDQYLNAFKTVYKSCEKEIKILNDPIYGLLVMYKGNKYRIVSGIDLDNYIEEVLTTELADSIPLNIWILVADGIPLDSRFHDKLRAKLYQHEFEILDKALSLSVDFNRSQWVFWNTLIELNDFEVYSKAINAAAEIWSIDVLTTELSEIFMIEGEDFIKEYKIGDFTSIYTEDDDCEVFHIYSVKEDADFNIFLP